ncbi:MAG TPA: selenium metabolism-associated LysR family transcriptional regulator [Dehalococcoidales bacterium]|nr:selenium metabolism-associated LysR family transcriptional regulator [Dehalococcoidales bacterium]
MNIDHLKTFQEIVRLGSFSEVAKKLGVSQPAVSFQIQKLEHQLGMRLIDRTQRAITLTAAGKRLLRFAESVESERDLLQHDLEQMREKVSGDLLIAASTIPGEFLLPPLLAKFKQRHPAVKIQVDISDSLAVINRVRDNTYEVGFCGMAPEGRDLASFKVAGDEIVLIVFPEHPFARKGEVSPDELEGEPFIFREATSGTQRSLESRLSQSGLDLRKFIPNLILGTTQAVVSAVTAGAGIAFVSNLAIKKSLALALVRQVGVRGLHLSRDFYCIYRQERVVSRLLEGFINFIKIEATHSDKGD